MKSDICCEFTYAFCRKLPAPRSGGLTVADSTLAAYTMPGAQSRLQKSQKAPAREIPPYLHRQGFIPRCEEDFGGGGAYPEIFVAQYPLGMGKESDVSRAKDAPGSLKAVFAAVIYEYVE